MNVIYHQQSPISRNIDGAAHKEDPLFFVINTIFHVLIKFNEKLSVVNELLDTQFVQELRQL